MPPTINTDDLIDAKGIAAMLGLSHSVSTYQKRYLDMPQPVLDLGVGRPRLWSRTDVERWARIRGWVQDQPHHIDPGLMLGAPSAVSPALGDRLANRGRRPLHGSMPDPIPAKPAIPDPDARPGEPQ